MQIFSIDARTGQTTDIVRDRQPGVAETFETQEYGNVQFKPTDDTGYASGSSDACQGSQWNLKHTSIAGRVDIPNGNTVAAYISFNPTGPDSLYIRGPAQQSGGFAANGDNSTFLDSAFAPDGTLWWLIQPDRSNVHKVEAYADGIGKRATLTFGSDVDLTYGTPPVLEFGANGSWAVHGNRNNSASDPEWVTPDGKRHDDATTPLHSAVPQLAAGLYKTLPPTHYAIGPFRLTADGKTVGFIATSPAGAAGLYSVPATGGSPTELTPVDLSALGASKDSMVYFELDGK